MGLIDSTENIANEIKTINSLNKAEETDREIKARLERQLELKFMGVLKLEYNYWRYKLLDLDEREKIVTEIGTNDFEYVRLNKMYDSVLNRVLKIYKGYQKYLDWNCNILKNKEKEKTNIEKKFEKTIDKNE